MQNLLIKLNKKAIIFSAVLLIVSVLIYANTLKNNFVYDDNHIILDNKWITDVRYSPEIFSSPAWGFSKINKYVVNFYRPIKHIIFMIDYHIFGFNSWGFHLTNVLLHSLATILIFFIVRKLFTLDDEGLSGNNSIYAFMAALLFAAHPIHTEVVAWVSDKLEIGLTLFYLLSFYLYICSKSITSAGFLLSVFFFFIALLTKETAVMLPVFLVLYDLLFEKRGHFMADFKGRLKRYVPYLLVFLLYLSMRTYALGKFASINTTYTELSWLTIPLNAILLFVRYFFKLLLPFNLNIYHTFNPVQFLTEPVVIFSLVFFLVFLSVLYITFVKKPLICLSLMWIVIPLIPVLYVPVIGDNPFTERYLYLPSVGFTFLIAIGIKEVAMINRNVLKYLVFATFVVTLLYSVGTISRNNVWQSDYTLWKDAAAKSPLKAATHVALGNAYEKTGSLDKALEAFNVALAVEKDSWQAQRNIGRVYRKMGLIKKAIYHYKKAIKLNPFSAEVRNDLGGIYGMEGRYIEAIGEFQQALALDPSLDMVQTNLERALQMLDKQ